MKVSLITTLFNEKQNILAFLDSYKNQSRFADEFIILDGGSNDGTISIIKDFILENKELNIRLIVDETCNKSMTRSPVAKGRNVAINNASFDLIAVTDAGCKLHKNWLKEMIEPFISQDIDVVSGGYKAIITNKFQEMYSKVAMINFETENSKNFLPSSRSIAFKKKCWSQVNGYPTKTYTAEDTIFAINLKNKNFNFYLNVNAIVYWECPKTITEALKKNYHYASGDGANQIFFYKFLVRFFFLLFPINIIINKHKRENMSLAYMLMVAYQCGYLKGLLWR